MLLLLLLQRTIAPRLAAAPRRFLASSSSSSSFRPFAPRSTRIGVLGGAGKAAHPSRNGSMATSARAASPVLAPPVADASEEVALLEGVDDDHGGVIVDMKTPMDPAAFTRSLRASIADWRKKGVRGVWIKLPIELANLVGPTVGEGFWYHHAEPSYLMLAYWIPETQHTLPINATHRVGVGAFVMNDKREVLVVQEKNGRLRGTGVWKFPTGVVEQAEDIHTGVVREVKEETGIDTEFVEVLAFRQSHMSFFEKSDLFFVCMLRPLSYDIQPQESEIEAAQWMPIDEYAIQPFVQKHDLLKYILKVCMARVHMGYNGFSPVLIRSAFSDKQDYLYFNTRDLKLGVDEVSVNGSSPPPCKEPCHVQPSPLPPPPPPAGKAQCPPVIADLPFISHHHLPATYLTTTTRPHHHSSSAGPFLLLLLFFLASCSCLLL